ncbi:AAA-ATPase ASD, mitochondrial-like [Typha latifolia]|uniref:AAA-ATPase ASD, mitochondrial-like n=1 Tax=Typha latifolia TaxID=4733 RepID=UPI003C30D98A
MFEKMAGVGSAMGSLLFLYTMLRQFLPPHLQAYFTAYMSKLLSWIDPYIYVSIPEYAGERMKRSEAYAAVEAYLSASCSQRARKLKAEIGKDSDRLLVSMGDHEEVTDDFQGTKLWWTSTSRPTQSTSPPWRPAASDEKRYYRLAFHKRQRELVMSSYLSHVLKEGREVTIKNRQRKLFTNIASNKYDILSRASAWSHVVFEHPSTFATLAMDPDKKKEIIDDLLAFRNRKEYYAKIGKAWKRGYLLYGPPGTGKSTMVAAMANLLDYDIYDLELTAVKDNTALRKLFIETTSKSIIVVEDVDCSLDLTGKRKDGKKTSGDKEDDGKEKKSDPEESSKVTLSGLLNFIDGLWSACGGERLIVFTTNHIEKLDPALIRRGRMDKHIEMSYCGFEAFKVLAKNYLDIDSHPLFDTIRQLLEEVNITPADVAENLTPKSLNDGEETCLGSLIQALKRAKEEGNGESSSSEETVIDASQN